MNTLTLPDVSSRRRVKPKPFPLNQYVADLAKSLGAVKIQDAHFDRWQFATIHGPLQVTPFDTWIACRFLAPVNPDKIPRQDQLNHYSFKWNINIHKHDPTARLRKDRNPPDAAACYAELIHRLNDIMPDDGRIYAS